MRRTSRIAVGVTTCVASVFLGTGAASATVALSSSGGTIVVDGSSEIGLSNIDVSYVSVSGNFAISTSRPMTASSPCFAFDPNFGVCPSAGVTRMNVLGGSGGDFIRLEPPGSDRFLSGIRYRVAGNAEADNLQGPRRPALFYGGTGNDSLIGDISRDQQWGGGGADFLAGFGGPDILDGGAGRNDTLNGGDGDDALNADDNQPDAAIDCGDGTDSALFDLGLDPAPFSCES